MTNQELAAAFREIGHCLRRTGEENQFRLKAYFRAAQQLELLDTELQSLVNAGDAYFKAYLIGHPGLGDKSRDKIYALCKTGTCPELDQVRKDMAAIGEKYQPEGQPDVTAASKEPKKTTRKASKNLREEVTAVRRPWAQAQEVVQSVMPAALGVFTQATVCGSYRRNLETVKDIDFVVTRPRSEKPEEQGSVEDCFTAILTALAIKPENIIKRGEAQMSFYINSPSGEWQVDFWFVDQESYGSAILFATGSADFNVEMRGGLKSRGYKLNRYGLYKLAVPLPAPNAHDEYLVASATEEGIFRALGLEFVPPPERIHFDPNRTIPANPCQEEVDANPGLIGE